MAPCAQECLPEPPLLAWLVSYAASIHLSFASALQDAALATVVVGTGVFATPAHSLSFCQAAWLGARGSPDEPWLRHRSLSETSEVQRVEYIEPVKAQL